MSNYKCPEAGCEFHVGISDHVESDEDLEMHQWYLQDIEDHKEEHRIENDTKVEISAKPDLTFTQIMQQMIEKHDMVMDKAIDAGTLDAYRDASEKTYANLREVAHSFAEKLDQFYAWLSEAPNNNQ